MTTEILKELVRISENDASLKEECLSFFINFWKKSVCI